MKKAKIALSVIALFAVVGGAFAFKAQKFGLGGLITSYTTTTLPNAPVYCTSVNTLITTADVAAPIRTYYTATTGVNRCPLTFFTSHITTTLPGN